jgi:SNF2 family DNA or RNA helicase
VIVIGARKGRAEIKTGTLAGADWLHYDSLMSEFGAPWEQATQARSLSLDLLPNLLARVSKLGLGRAVFDPGVSQALRARARRFSPPLDGLDPRLAMYQLEGIAYLRARWAGILGDDMGLGKTAQLLQAIMDPPRSRVLVVCPALAKGVWRYEAQLWAPGLKVRILSGKGSFAWPKPGECIVTNYDILPRATDPLPDPPDGVYLIYDEAHYLKGQTIRSKSARRISRAVRLAAGRAWAATGTPLDNKPPDLYRIAEAIGIEKEFGSWPNFVKLFGGRKTKFGYDWGMPMPAAKTIVERIMLRRKKTDVLNLPPVTTATRPVEIARADQVEIDEAIRRSGVRLSDITEEALRALAQNPHIMTARRLLAAAKYDAVTEWIEEAEDAGEPVVVFSAHRAPVDRLGARPGWRVITGDTSQDDRTKIAAEMQAGRLKGVAGTIRAMGVAITLTRPCLAAFVDQEWNPGANQQARDRLVRIGQARPVTIYTFVADHPVDVRVAEILAVKTERQLRTVDAITTTPDSVRAEAMLRLAADIDAELM